MFKRYSLALLGATVVTAILVLGMSQIAEMFEREDSQVYMRVMDFIPGSGTRRLPDKRMPEAQPDRAELETGDLATDVLGPADPLSSIPTDTGDIEVSIDLDTTPED